MISYIPVHSLWMIFPFGRHKLWDRNHNVIYKHLNCTFKIWLTLFALTTQCTYSELWFNLKYHGPLEITLTIKEKRISLSEIQFLKTNQSNAVFPTTPIEFSSLLGKIIFSPSQNLTILILSGLLSNTAFHLTVM